MKSTYLLLNEIGINKKAITTIYNQNYIFDNSDNVGFEQNDNYYPELKTHSSLIKYINHPKSNKTLILIYI